MSTFMLSGLCIYIFVKFYDIVKTILRKGDLIKVINIPSVQFINFNRRKKKHLMIVKVFQRNFENSRTRF